MRFDILGDLQDEGDLYIKVAQLKQRIQAIQGQSGKIVLGSNTDQREAHMGGVALKGKDCQKEHMKRPRTTQSALEGKQLDLVALIHEPCAKNLVPHRVDELSRTSNTVLKPMGSISRIVLKLVGLKKLRKNNDIN